MACLTLLPGLAQLLSSLDIKTAGSSQAGAKPIDARAAQVLAEKLSQILGEDGAGPAVRRNEKGQVLNEEGLPVIEITESASANQPIPSAGVPQVTAHVPLSALTDAQKAARKREVDRILDELEKEEEEEERKKGAVAQADAAEITKKERERAMENMAKALAATNRLQLQQHRAQVANAQPTQAEAIPSPSTVTPTQLLTRPSKKVKFTDDAVKELEAQGESVDMGDVIMGRPRPKPDLSASLADQPLKLHVVERAPTNLHAGDGAKVQVVEDSDDETDDELDDADFFTVQAEEHALGLGEEGDGTDGIEDDDEGFESGEDFDSAMLQRDAAAMYYSKRQDLRAGTGAFAGFGQIAIPAEGWDAEDVKDTLYCRVRCTDACHRSIPLDQVNGRRPPCRASNPLVLLGPS
ncbi:hypothetical protein CALVIDRAFT_64123 [Calocera viscosa TUFC12733]|uniref:Uncharacterized protein n=1 Tax=Calocera viscosa (strain TUFC12733) TaxID=1330018 RepID=A0A167NNS4_CALVF|nr:hypothetical protein CALVIDRAFT_64123 [Calocera viscosa TUFC12733]